VRDTPKPKLKHEVDENTLRQDIEEQVKQEEDDFDEEKEYETYEPETLEYDAEKINVSLWQPTVYQILKRIDQNILDLEPDFQRHSDIWNIGVKSRMIESILIRIPLPAFYIDTTDENHWLIVDGLQRLMTLKKFCENKFRLSGLEYLKELKGKEFQDLHLIYQSKIEDYQITVYRIEKGTPYQVRYNIFHRINTGGEHLTYQEIRHALNPGPVLELLKELADNQDFKDTAKLARTKIKRMEDREYILRFFAFKLTEYKDYRTGLRKFLDDAMFALNKLYKEDRDKFYDLKREFAKVMKDAKDILGLYAFRKPPIQLGGKPPVENQPNRALFEVWSVLLSKRGQKEIEVLKDRRTELIDKFNNLKKTKKFMRSISISQGDAGNVKYRFRTIEDLIKDVLND